MIYIIYITFWMSTGEICHSSYEAALNNRPVTSRAKCEEVAKSAQARFNLICDFDRNCVKAEAVCKHVPIHEFFHSKHRQNKNEHINQKGKRKVRSRQK